MEWNAQLGNNMHLCLWLLWRFGVKISFLIKLDTPFYKSVPKHQINHAQLSIRHILRTTFAVDVDSFAIKHHQYCKWENLKSLYDTVTMQWCLIDLSQNLPHRFHGQIVMSLLIQFVVSPIRLVFWDKPSRQMYNIGIITNSKWLYGLSYPKPTWSCRQLIRLVPCRLCGQLMRSL